MDDEQGCGVFKEPAEQVPVMALSPGTSPVTTEDPANSVPFVSQSQPDDDPPLDDDLVDQVDTGDGYGDFDQMVTSLNVS